MPCGIPLLLDESVQPAKSTARNGFP